jgi:Tfp pilus assembly protein PilX
MNMIRTGTHFSGPRHQRGVATLLVAVVMLVILTIIVLASSNVALFEQKTTTNENRQQMVDQAAEYYLNLGGEYLKANVVNIASNQDDDGWLTAGGTNLHWVQCPSSPASNHPCYTALASVRSRLYYYTTDGTAVTDGTSTKLDLPYSAVIPSGARLTGVGNVVGGVSTFPITGHVRALMCRLDTTPGTTPSCLLSPVTGNRIAITLLASASITGENANAEVKETWGTYSNFTAVSAVPLVAAGYIKGLGDGSVVTSANAGGYGLPASMWSPNDIDVDGSGIFGGVGSFSTCHLGDYLGSVPVGELETTCAGSGNTGCSCSNVPKGSPDMLSGHYGGSYTQESFDVLDVDGSTTDSSEDIQFFPGKTSAGVRMDHQAVGGTCLASQPYCETDDNLFEWIFQQDVNGGDADGYPISTTSTVKGKTLTDWHPTSTIADKEKDVLINTLGAQSIANCNALNTSSTGLYYVTGSCTMNSDVGSKDNQVVVVADGDITVNGNFNFFGMLFVRDAGAGASIKGTGNVNVFGAVVVEGDVDVAGNFSVIYLNISTGTPGSKNSPTTRFARLPGSWLDSNSVF